MIRLDERYHVEVGIPRENRVDWQPLKLFGPCTLEWARDEASSQKKHGRLARVVRSRRELVEDDDMPEILVERRRVKTPARGVQWLYNLTFPPGYVPEHDERLGMASVSAAERRAKTIAKRIGAVVRRSWS